MPITPATATHSSSNGTADAILLELVDENGVTIGTAEKLSAHQPPGRLHRAFSVFLFDERGRLLLQQRALGKYHSPGVWSNTCCGHPYPGEAPFAAAARRTHEELGVSPSLLAEAGTVRYNHPDPASGLVEQEYNHLFVGLVQAAPRPRPGGGGRDGLRGPGRAGRAAREGHLLGVVHDGAGRGPARRARADGSVGRVVSGPSSGRA